MYRKPLSGIMLTMLLVWILASAFNIELVTPASPGSFWSFVQITDLHYGYDSERNGAVHDAIMFIDSKRIDYNISFTIITGDLIDNTGHVNSSETNFQNLKQYLDTNLDTRYWTVQGNHDQPRTLYLEYFGDHQTDNSSTYYSFVNNSYRFIAIGQDQHPDTVNSTELDFLEAELRNPGTPIVAFHECLASPDQRYEITNPQEVISVMEARDARLFICGHAHRYDHRKVGDNINHVILGPAFGRGQVAFYKVNGTTVTMERWLVRDAAFRYNPTLVNTVEMDIGRPPVHDLAIIEVTANSTTATNKDSVSIDVTVRNVGYFAETFNVTVYRDAEIIGVQTVADLYPGEETRLTIIWKPSGVAEGVYTIKAEASVVGGEENTADNTLVVGTVSVIVPPEAFFTHTPVESLVGDTVTFNASESYDPNGNVTSWRWDFGDGTTGNGVAIDHIYKNAGTFTVNLTVTDNDGLTEVNVKPIEIGKIPTSISISTRSPSTLAGFNVNITGTLQDMYGRGLKNETVSLHYASNGTSEWIPITSNFTDGVGHYSVTWLFSGTGNFVLRAEWTGNTTHSETSDTATLSSLVYDNQHVFVESNYTISQLSLNTEKWKLSFALTGPNGTRGYVKVTAAKSLVANIANTEIYLDGKKSKCVIASLADSWLWAFTCTRNTHQVVVTLGYLQSDLNIDGIVDIFDAIIVARAFGSRLGDPEWNPAADLVEDHVIDIYDVVAVAKDFGKT